MLIEDKFKVFLTKLETEISSKTLKLDSIDDSEIAWSSAIIHFNLRETISPCISIFLKMKSSDYDRYSSSFWTFDITENNIKSHVSALCFCKKVHI